MEEELENMQYAIKCQECVTSQQLFMECLSIAMYEMS